MAFFQFNDRDANAPTRRECHTICMSGELLVLFGGNDDVGRFRAVHILDTVSMRWEKVGSDAAGMPSDPHTPGRRSAHTAVMDAQERWMYVFGGWNGSEELGDVTRFDMGALSWRALRGAALTCKGARAARLSQGLRSWGSQCCSLQLKTRRFSLSRKPPSHAQQHPSARSLAHVGKGGHHWHAPYAAALSHGCPRGQWHVRLAQPAARPHPAKRPLLTHFSPLPPPQVHFWRL